MTSYMPIPSFPGYRAGDDGTIASCWKRGWRNGVRKMGAEWKELKLSPCKSGHLRVNIATPDGTRAYKFVHQLVLEAWHGPCPRGCEARHLNDIPTCNTPDNLCWGTRSQNMDDRRRNGTLICGSKSQHAKLTAETIAEAIRRCGDGETQRTVAASLGVAQSQISRAIRGERWSHLS